MTTGILIVSALVLYATGAIMVIGSIVDCYYETPNWSRTFTVGIIFGMAALVAAFFAGVYA